MTAYLPYDLQSLLPGHKGTPSNVPEVGEQAPAIEGVSFTKNLHLIAFVRHCGCPFAEAELKSLGEVQKRYPNVHVIVVSHSKQEVVDDWFERIGKPKFANLNQVKVIADPEYKIYDSFGIGQLGYSGLFSMSMVTELRNLASKGIKNTTTGQGSNRWQNSGGFAVDQGGVVRWRKVATNAGDTCDYQKAVKTIIS
ncbi:hypothetical protein CBS101457_006403 [Exobasidium rhododendri]|nr:hypothetical protein CBS101457_006403 [Exobasidium rhododendri]